MKKKLLALALALTMCFGTTMTANAAMNISNKMGALDTHNILDENSSKIPKGTLQYMASKFKIEYTQEDLKALKKIFDANLYAKAYPDVAAAYGNDREALWNHYVTHGIKEGRTQINSGFNVFAYISAYPDLRNAFGDDLVAYYVHYANNGINENRKLTTVDAATRAGITVTGLQGQVIARPAPIQVPDLSSYSVPDSVPKSDTVIDTPTPVSPTEEPGCNHVFDGMKQIDGTTTHGPLCKICGYVDTENTEACKADHCDSVDDSYHNEICKACGGVIKEEPHQYNYELGIGKDGEPIHKGKCNTCQNEMEKPCVFDEGSDECTVCHNRHTEHQWDSSDGHCKFCGVTCGHEWAYGKCKVCGKTCDHPSKDNNDTCTVCGYHSDSTSGMFENLPE